MFRVTAESGGLADRGNQPSIRRIVLAGAALAATLLVTFPQPVQGQQSRADSLWQVEMREVVVTATRGARDIRDVPVPTQVVTARTVREQGASRLADLLAEHPGLVVTHDQFGAGIQLQGFDSAYTLILIDGEPVIGREGGTIDLERLPVGDIERVEIVRGPSSSLYGSEALAGVINIITREPNGRFGAQADARYETHGTSDLSLSVDTRSEKWSGRLSLNRYGSSGYDLVPEVPGLTAPSFHDASVTGHAEFKPRSGSRLRLGARYADMSQVSTVGFAEQGQVFTFEEDAGRTDWNVSGLWEQRLAPGYTATTRLLDAGSSNFYVLLNRELADEASEVLFAQRYRKAETQVDAILGLHQIATVGTGFVGETVEADRVKGGRRDSRAAYLFGQHQWFPSNRVQLNTSARFDWHSEYATRLSPKVSGLIRPNDKLLVRASVGTGFKAPTFQQLYMDFTNPVAGYSVVGSSDIAAAMSGFEQAGQIAYYLTDPSAFSSILPESSVAFNAGIEWNPGGRLNLQLNFFRNNVQDLIEHQPVAAKPNGQFVFTYVNLHRIYTQGIEAELTWQPFRNWTVSGGWQLLDARDRDVLDEIDAGTLYGRRDGRDFRLTRSDYGGLFNRSRYAGSIRLTYREANTGTTATLRVVTRSRYGYGDLNGNLILDDDREYVPGFTLVHVTATRRLTDRVEGQFGIKNLLDTTYPTLVPSMPGRLLFAGIQLKLNS